MTDISKERVDGACGMCRLHGLHGTEQLLRAFQARVEELEAERDARVSEWVAEKREKAAKRNGRLQGLDEAIEAIGKVTIPIGQTKTIWKAQDAIEALRGESQ